PGRPSHSRPAGAVEGGGDPACASRRRRARWKASSRGRPRVASFQRDLGDGFHPGFEWIDVPIARDAHGEPVQVRGVVESEPGLYFVGLHFLYAFSSTMIHGVARDAKYVADAVIRRLDASRAPQAPRKVGARNSHPALAT